ncbi:MAG: hypothetical protein M3342_21170 [Bacteroidota bacterium]|nr:hypothetical protein [Bacteroidota bacterium]
MLLTDTAGVRAGFVGHQDYFVCVPCRARVCCLKCTTKTRKHSWVHVGQTKDDQLSGGWRNGRIQVGKGIAQLSFTGGPVPFGCPPPAPLCAGAWVQLTKGR